MTVFAIVFGLAVTALIAALLLAMPAIVRPSLPLGVSVPQSRAGEPVVRTAIRRYRWGVAAAWAVSSIGSVALAQALPSLVLAVMPLVFLVLSAIVYVVTRRTILAAKRDGNWYEGVPTRLVADATPPKPGHPPLGWTLAAVLVLTATIGVGVAVYPSLPSTVATHWNAAGHVNATAPKSIWSVFGVQVITLLVVLAFYGLSWLTTVTPMRAVASDAPEQAGSRADAQRHLASTGLGIVAFAISVALGCTSVVGWLAPGSTAWMTAALVITMVLVLGAVAAIVVRYARAMAVASTRAEVSAGARPPGVRADAPDDDRYWKLGAVYINRNDPATFVPKRFGVGWTINLGSPGGIVFAVVTLLIVAGAIVTAIVVPVTR